MHKTFKICLNKFLYRRKLFKICRNKYISDNSAVFLYTRSGSLFYLGFEQAVLCPHSEVKLRKKTHKIGQKQIHFWEPRCGSVHEEWVFSFICVLNRNVTTFVAVLYEISCLYKTINNEKYSLA